MKGLLFLLPALFFLYPKACLTGCKAGLSLWANELVPALFPYFTSAYLLLYTGALQGPAVLLRPLMRMARLPARFAQTALCALTAGSPFAAGAAAQALDNGEMQNAEAVRFLSFTALTGPVFALSVLGTQYLHSTLLGLVCYLFHLLGGLCNLLIWRFHARKEEKNNSADSQMQEAETCSFWLAFPKALEKSGSSMLSIGTSVVLFCTMQEILSTLLPQSLPPLTKGLLWGVLEVTSGLRTLAPLLQENRLVLPLLCALLSFGGLCICLQSVTLLGGRFAGYFFLQRCSHALCTFMLACVVFLLPCFRSGNLAAAAAAIHIPHAQFLLPPAAQGILSLLFTLCCLPKSVFLLRQQKRRRDCKKTVFQ